MILILGAGGIGKTKELKVLCSQLVDEGKLPCFRSLKTYSVGERIERYLPEDWKLLDPDHFYLILDGLDEVGVDNFMEVCKDILRTTEKHQQLRLIVSCRSVFLERGGDIFSSSFKTYELEGVDANSQDARRYITENFRFEPDHFLSECYQKSLLDLVSNPFFLDRTLALYSKKRSLPDNIATLFDELTKESLRHDKSKFKLIFGFDGVVIKTEKALQRVALICEMMCQNYISEEGLIEAITEKELALLRHIMIFKKEESENAQWKFEHNNFQEILAAKKLSEFDFDSIIALISLSPYSVINPSWANTVIFLFNALERFPDSKKRFMAWILEHDMESIVAMESEKIPADVRFKVFISIFNKYKESGIWLESSKFTSKQLAGFGQSDETLTILLKEITLESNTRVIRLNAIRVIQYLDISKHESDVREALYQCINQLSDDPPFVHSSLYAMERLGLVTPGDLDWLMTKLGHRFNQYIRSGLYKLIEKSETQVKYLDFLLSGIKFIGESGGADRDNIHVYGEESNLIQAIGNIKDGKAIKTVIELLTKKDLPRRSSYFVELSESVVKQAINLHNSESDVYAAVLTWFKSLSEYFLDELAAKTIVFFDQTKTKSDALNDILLDKDNKQRFFHAAKLVDEDSMPFLITLCQENTISNDELDFLYRIVGGERSQLGQIMRHEVERKTNYKIKQTSTIDHENIRRQKLENRLNILIDYPVFKSEVYRVFNDLNKDILEWDDIWEIQKQEHSNYSVSEKYNSQIVDFLLDFARGDKDVDINEVKTFLNDKDGFQSYAVGEIQAILNNNEHLKLSKKQEYYVLSWCKTTIPKIDFSKGLRTLEDGSSEYTPAAEAIWFFAVKLGLEFEKEVVLNFLHMFRMNDGPLEEPEDKVSYFTSRVSTEELLARAIENLENGISDSGVIIRHLNFLLIHNHPKASYYLKKEALNIKRGEHHRDRVLTLIEKKDRWHNIFAELLVASDYYLRWQIVRKLDYSNELTVAENYLVKVFDNPESNDDRINAAEYLVKLSNLDAIVFFIDWLKGSNLPLDDFSNRHECLSKIKSVEALPYLFDLLEFSYANNKMVNAFDRLDAAVLSGIESIAQSSRNGFDSVITGLNNFMTQSSYEHANFLHFNVERIKKTYFGKVSTSYTFREALSKMKQLESGN